MEDVRGFYRDILIDKESETVVGKDLGINWYTLAQDQLGGMWRDQAAPGEEVVVSNFAVGYVAALVEWALIMDQNTTSGNDASGQRPLSTSFANFSQQFIFEPLGMQNTSWFLRDFNATADIAMPVEPINDQETQFKDIGHYCMIDYASGSLFSSAVDMAKFLTSMLNYGVPGLWSNPELGRSALNCLEHDSNGQPVENCEFGAAWTLMQSAADQDWVQPYQIYNWASGAEAAGQDVGAQTQIIVLPQAGVFGVVLTNTDGNDALAAQILAMTMLETIHPSGSTMASGLLAWVGTATLVMSIILW
jgi:CubicO group peptidase (beta-lactamase class C family)